MIDILAFTAAGKRIAELRRIYAEIADAQSRFSDNAGIACPDGCGECCNSFVPAISRTEAECIAEYLIEKKIDAGAFTDREDGGCPFRKTIYTTVSKIIPEVNPDEAATHGCSSEKCTVSSDGVFDVRSDGACAVRSDGAFAVKSDGACSIYEARPLVCRLFGFAGIRSKDGQPEYRLCRLMKEPARSKGERHWRGESIQKSLGSVPPLMGDYGSLVEQIDPDSMGKPETMLNAVRKAYESVSMILSFLGRNDPNDDPENTPDGNIPRPGKRSA